MISARHFIKLSILFLLLSPAVNKTAFAQNTSSLSGIVVDQNGALVPNVEITVVNAGGTLERTVFTDGEGFFSFPLLPSDQYTLKISKEGFDPSEIPDLIVTAENPRRFRIELRINPLAEKVKVEVAPNSADENRTGSTTFNRTFFENFPVNGRRYQGLLSLVPGVVLTPVDAKNLGQFSTNGQRTNANYFTVDGVSANFGTTNYNFLGQTGSGSIPAMSVQGGLDNLVSTEAVQEVEIRTLDFAPANGKMPGAELLLVSRAGGNRLSFSVFENFRHAAFNAKDFFDLEKPPHILNNFGGSLGGPLPFFKKIGGLNQKTFFFAAFESKNFTLPQPTVLAEVPSVDLRKDARNPIAQAVFNSFPLPNDQKIEPPSTESAVGPSLSENGAETFSFFPKTAPFRATYADPNKAESYNLRIDHLLGSKISLFARFNYAPSVSENRNPANLSAFVVSRQFTRTFTFGSAQMFSSNVFNELRLNLSRQTSDTQHNFDGLYGGVLPDKSLFIPTALNPNRTYFQFSLQGFPDSLAFLYGNYAQNEMRQLFVSDNLSYSVGQHDLKFGFDFRRLSPTLRTSGDSIGYEFDSAESIFIGLANRVFYYQNPNVETQVFSVSAFAQDNWKLGSKLNFIYGLRWELNPAPTAANQETLRTLEKPPEIAQLDQTGLRLAPAGTPYYRTSFRNFAPRFGVALELFDKTNYQLVLRGGFGTFFDLGQSQFNELVSPFEHINNLAENLILPIRNFPTDLSVNPSENGRRPAIVSAVADYRLPRTYSWSFSAQLKSGDRHFFSSSYIGNAGRALQRTLTLNLAESNVAPNIYFSDKFSKISYIDNAHSSDYHALQLQYTFNAPQGLRYFVNYTWAHSIDDNSSDNNVSRPFLKTSVKNDRGNSDFDVRHSLNIGFSYDVPSITSGGFWGNILQNWNFGGIFSARTGLPFDVKIVEFNPLFNDLEVRRADIDNRLPTFVTAPESPLGFKLNAEAFTKPENSFIQGNLGRNVFTGPAVWQFDASLQRKIRLNKKGELLFRVEVFNVFNRPNFANPLSRISYRNDERSVPAFFGMPTKTMARGYASDEPTGGVSPIFQTGGPRMLQFGIRLTF